GFANVECTASSIEILTVLSMSLFIFCPLPRARRYRHITLLSVYPPAVLQVKFFTKYSSLPPEYSLWINSGIRFADEGCLRTWSRQDSMSATPHLGRMK